MPLGGTAGRLELRLDPVDGVPVAAGALPAVAELRQAPDDGLVVFQIEPADQDRDRVVRATGGRLLLAGNGAPVIRAARQQQRGGQSRHSHTHWSPQSPRCRPRRSETGRTETYRPPAAASRSSARAPASRLNMP